MVVPTAVPVATRKPPAISATSEMPAMGMTTPGASPAIASALTGATCSTVFVGADGMPVIDVFGADVWIPEVLFAGFQLTFAIITVALISGAIADRVKFSTWMVFVPVWLTLVYFPIAHMVWGGGLLSHSENGLAAMLFGTTDDGDGGLVGDGPQIMMDVDDEMHAPGVVVE